MRNRDVLSPPRLSNRMKWMISGMCLLLFLAMIAVIALIGLNQNMRRAEVLIIQGNGYYEEMEYDQAELCYKEAIMLRSGDVNAYLSLGRTYLAKGNLSDAIAVLESGYKKTNDASILAELEQLQNENASALSGNRSVLSVTNSIVTDKISSITTAFVKNTQAAPGTVVQNQAVVPEIDPNEVAAMRTASAKGNDSEDVAGNSSDSGNGNAADAASELSGTAQETVVQTTDCTSGFVQQGTTTTTTMQTKTEEHTTASITEVKHQTDLAKTTHTEITSYTVGDTALHSAIVTTTRCYLLTDADGTLQTMTPEQWEQWYYQWQHSCTATIYTESTITYTRSTNTTAMASASAETDHASTSTTVTLAEWQQWYAWWQSMTAVENSITSTVVGETTHQTTSTATMITPVSNSSGTITTTTLTEDSTQKQEEDRWNRFGQFWDWLMEKLYTEIIGSERHQLKEG